MFKLNRIIVLLIAALGTMHIGCMMFISREVTVEYMGKLDDKKQVELIQEQQEDMLRSGPEHNYARIFLALTHGKDQAVLRMEDVGRIGGDFGEHPRFKFGALEGRSDSTGQRIWIIDKEHHRVIASLDRTTDKVTGYQDEAPTWARLDGGNVLKNVAR